MSISHGLFLGNQQIVQETVKILSESDKKNAAKHWLRGTDL